MAFLPLPPPPRRPEGPHGTRWEADPGPQMESECSAAALTTPLEIILFQQKHKFSG
jgi:hypothetical protein